MPVASLANGKQENVYTLSLHLPILQMPLALYLNLAYIWRHSIASPYVAVKTASAVVLSSIFQGLSNSVQPISIQNSLSVENRMTKKTRQRQGPLGVHATFSASSSDMETLKNMNIAEFVLHFLSSEIHEERLYSLCLRRTWVERQSLPLYSKYTQSLIELCISLYTLRQHINRL